MSAKKPRPHCLWCGRPIRPWSTERGLKMALNRAARQKERTQNVFWDKVSQETSQWHEAAKDKYGYLGTGHFCNTVHAGEFAIAAARSGWRRNPVDILKTAETLIAGKT